MMNTTTFDFAKMCLIVGIPLLMIGCDAQDRTTEPFYIRSVDGSVVEQLDQDLLIAIEEDLATQGRTDDADRLQVTYDFESGALVQPPAEELRAFLPEDLRYSAHVHDRGWQGVFGPGETAGTTGETRFIEAYRVSSDTLPGETRPALSYAAHVQSSGWLPAVSWDGVAGTTGQRRRMEAMRCSSSTAGWTCWYRAHVADIGWQGWFSEGQTAGTVGQSRALEAFQMQLLNY